ncbi:brefeldin A-inhibited guanine nucleotide-exchange protein 3-like isoform X3 [Artemia franciscana]|uniref:brefeldin A-inhibited guanine nucleotide-exchange protein 3-like isoform X3 n=1 Tax=Artemia franciscana TaxID=6661 RepID=UPI0032DB1BB1
MTRKKCLCPRSMFKLLMKLLQLCLIQVIVESVNAFSALQDAARLFVKNLVDNNLCPFMNQRSIIHLDDQLQKFANRSCKGLRDLEGFQMDVTGDDLYILASLSVYLNAVMEKALFFTDQVDSSYLMTEAGFVELAESWGLCALGSVFLGEVYQSTVENNWGILSSSSSLASFVHDIGIKGNGGCYLTVCDRLYQVGKLQERSPDADAAKKLARYILTSVWTQLVSILAIGMGSAPDQGIESVLGNTENLSPGTISGAIVSLHLLANLCCELELNEKCEAIFSLLVSSVFISPDDKIMERLKRRRKKKSYWPSHAPRKSNNALTYSQALSITVTLTTGLELASIEPGCWKHVLRCCSYISSLENERVSTSRTKELLGKTTPRLENLRRKFSSKPLNGQASEEEDECIDVYGFIKAATSRVTSSFEVDSLLQNARSNLVGFDSEVAEKALVSIASIAERMFEDAGTKLNLLSLVNFMKELCRASLRQLESVADDPKGSLFLLRKTEDVTLKVIRSRRPLLHVWRVWMIFSNHVLMVCHRFVGECTTVALTSLHLVINAILGEISESRLFRTNEKLFLPYEKLLKNPLISPLVLKQVLESIKDLISYHGIQEIKSGWNALFRILRLSPAQIESLDVVSETLEDCARTFLSLNDVYITADCLFEMINTLVWFFKDYFSSSTLPSLSGKYIIQLLEYVVRAHQSKILPSFRVTEPQSIFSRLCQVDFSVLNYKLVKFAESPDASAQFEDFIFHQSSSNALEFLANNSNLEDLSCHLEDPSNSTQLVLSLFLKLTESFVVFPSDQVVFTLIQGLWTLTKHNEYVLVSSTLRFCLLPTLQKTLQKDMSSQLSKQIATQTSELIVHMYAEKKDTEKQGQLSSHLPFLLRDFLIVMVGASASGQEAGMSIGISCFRMAMNFSLRAMHQ